MRPAQFAYQTVAPQLDTSRAETSKADTSKGPEPPAPRRGRRRPGRSRYTVEVVTTSGRAAGIEFRIEDDAVEIWHLDRCRGVFPRDFLRDWMAPPGHPLVASEVGLSVDRMVDAQGRVALSLPDVSLWTLSPQALEVLRTRL